MSDLHPFLQAVQLAHDLHGLPPNVVSVTIMHTRFDNGTRFSVGMGRDRLYSQSTGGHGATLVEAYAECAAKEAAFDDKAAQRAQAAALLQSAGLPVELLARA